MQHDEAVRYARTLSLPQIGEEGQAVLSRSKVLIVGAGGLGSPLALYLAAAGVGTLGVVDADRVALSNLNRQILFETGDIGRAKVESAVDTLHHLNPEVTVVPHALRLDAQNAAELVGDYDIVADGSDNIATRYAVNDACLQACKTLVSAAVIGFEGQLYTFKPHTDAALPCYRCLYPTPPANMPTCAESGVLGSVAGILGSWQATEVIKELLGIGVSLAGSMQVINALKGECRKVRLPRDPACVHYDKTLDGS